MKILVFGSLNLDYVYQVEHFVKAGETLASAHMEQHFGGKGLNQAIAFRRSGMEVFQAGAIGKQDSGLFQELLNRENISADYITKKDCPTGHAIIQVTPQGENSILLFGGANQRIAREEIDRTLMQFTSEDVIVLQNEINEIPYIIHQAKERGMRVVLNPSPMSKEILQYPLNLVDYLIVNEIEAAVLLQQEYSEEENMIRSLQNMFPSTELVLTLGEKGAYYIYKGKKVYEKAIPVQVVDTTGAGDTFTGYFFGSLFSGKSPEMALHIAAKAAALAVSRKGASDSIPRISEVI